MSDELNEQEKQLEQARIEREAAEQRAKGAEKEKVREQLEAEKLAAERTRLETQNALTKQMQEMGIRTDCPPQMLYKLLGADGITFTHASDGTIRAFDSTGKPLALAELLQTYATNNPMLFDRTEQRKREEAEQKKLNALTAVDVRGWDLEKKSKFVAEHGEAEWRAIQSRTAPLNTNVNTMGPDDLKRLSRERPDLRAQISAADTVKIMARRPKTDEFGRQK